MIDNYLLPPLRILFTPVAQILQKRAISADQISLAGFGIGVLALPCLALGWFIPALVLILCNRIADGLDGTLARLTSPTDRGAFLDIALDFFFYGLIPVGFALADPSSNALPAAILIASFIGTGSSFLAFANIAQKRGLSARDYPQKGIYYLGGLTEGTETIVIFAAMCLWPAAFPALALIFAAACLFTTVTRWHMGWKTFADPDL